MQSIANRVREHGIALFAALTFCATFFALHAGAGYAAADSTTGIDYQADVASPVIAAAKPAILAGLAVLVLVMAITLGKRLWGKVSGTR